MRFRWTYGALAVGLALCAGRAASVTCSIDPAPAATLLLPYFSLDTAQCGFPQETTLATVINTSSSPVLTHVTVWTNLGIPAAGFDLYLQGNDSQSLNLGDLVCDGLVPVTGPATSPAGEASASPVSYPGCGDPVAASLSTEEVADLQAALNGDPVPSTGLCSALPTGRAEGYLTVDVVFACSIFNPADPSYYAGIISFVNVLAGDYQYVDPVNNFAQGFEMVHVEADTAAFNPGDVTFYGRYNGATAVDRREPLATAFRTPFDLTEATSTGTYVIVWRETSAAAAPMACGALPGWFPLPLNAAVLFPDEDTAGLGGLPAHAALPVATQRVPLGTHDFTLHPETAETGWLHLNLQHPVSPYSTSLRVGQGWVSGIRSSLGRYSTGQHAAQLDSACAPSSFPFTLPGRATTTFP